MVVKKPRIVIIGAGMAGLTAANKLYTSPGSEQLFELCIVEGGSRIGGRINTSEFGGDRIEMGATWIHGIGGSPVHKIAQEINSLESEQPWECKDGFLDDPTTIAEGGFQLNPSMVDSIYTLFNKLMDFAKGNLSEDSEYFKLAAKASEVVSQSIINGGFSKPSVGSFLQKGLQFYLESMDAAEQEEVKGYGNWSKKKKLLQEAIFAIHENTQRTYTSAGDLLTLDYEAESEYRLFPGEEITIAKGYTSIIESLGSVLPPGLIQLGRKVAQIEWQSSADAHHHHRCVEVENAGTTTTTYRPVKLHFCDGSIMTADHVIVTVSLGVLKAGIGQGQEEDSGMFNPPLPSFKKEVISKLGFGLVNKLFVQISPAAQHDQEEKTEEKFNKKFPFLQLAFHRSDSELKHKKIPWWMRKTASLSPIYKNSSVLLSWFAGKEAFELENLNNEEILNGVSTTISSFLSPTPHVERIISSPNELLCNGNSTKSTNGDDDFKFKFIKVLKSQWGTDPLFLGSYSYIAVGSSGEDIDLLAEPLPAKNATSGFPLQVLFAGEATHRTHYSTTHGAYFSGLREANRLLQHYHCVGV